MSLMRNGTTDWWVQNFCHSKHKLMPPFSFMFSHRQKIERLIDIMAKELGGQEAFLKSYIENYTHRLAESKLNSTIICFIFDK